MTELNLYNSLTKRKDVFKPIKAGEASLYSCGPTVYDQAHIGNFRAFIVADLLQRTLRHVAGLNVHWVMNITDIDDKMIVRAHERQPGAEPKAALKALADEYESQFLAELQAVGVELDDLEQLPHATEHVDQMQDLIRRLMHDKAAYIVDGSIYFSLDAYKEAGHTYGQLSNVNFASQSRIDDQDQKQGAGDFALWKAAKDGEPSWDFDLDGANMPGRPGWHIECSAMSTTYLGNVFDLHTGGVDLKFPHHENEIAQSGGELAHFWLHNEHLNVESTKMSKSLGNFKTLSDIDDPLAFRLLVLQAHYRSQMDFTADSYTAAKLRLKALREWASKLCCNQLPSTPSTFTRMGEAFDVALADDLSTPQALAVLAEAQTQPLSIGALEFLHHADAILGLGLIAHAVAIDDPEVEALMAERLTARTAHDWDQSDLLRDQLRARGVGVEDTPSGQIKWRLEP